MQRAASSLPGAGCPRKDLFFPFCLPPQTARMILQQPCPLPVYTLTRICFVEYTKRVELVFKIIAEDKEKTTRPKPRT